MGRKKSRCLLTKQPAFFANITKDGIVCVRELENQRRLGTGKILEITSLLSLLFLE
ncbi:hypothetical protein DSOL_2447 [Desulfosporosinus metallidurans]|uniref:Uncharacterized protein n=1 Tax=Desulfosporosinus metallidurans TaxID=1888891 RepID=A0A1Q8QW99_9FIRM|nr:hypothetical protein DSOL_2447 [Desulfosporosinus metallidurans]